MEDGLPSDHIFAVKVDGPKVWMGTEDGLALIDKTAGKIVKTWKEKDGLPFQAVTAIDVDQETGDVWLGLFGGGLARFSGGRFDHFHQLNSGLVNDVVYGVAVERDNVWAATTAGARRLQHEDGRVADLHREERPDGGDLELSESTTRARCTSRVWGSGVLEYDLKTGSWKDYMDPDGEMEIDLYRDDGIIHVIVTGVSHVEESSGCRPTSATRRYDGRHWRGYAEQDGGIPSDFINVVKAPERPGGAVLHRQGPRRHRGRSRGHLGRLHPRPRNGRGRAMRESARRARW